MASFTILLDKVTMPKGLSLIAGYQGYLLSILYGMYRIHTYPILSFGCRCSEVWIASCSRMHCMEWRGLPLSCWTEWERQYGQIMTRYPTPRIGTKIHHIGNRTLYRVLPAGKNRPQEKIGPAKNLAMFAVRPKSVFLARQAFKTLTVETAR